MASQRFGRRRLVLVAVGVAAVAIAWGEVTGDRHRMHLVTIASIWTLWGISLNLVWGYAGQFSMLSGGLGAIAAYGTAIAVQDHSVPFWLAAALATLVASGVSGLVGLAALRLSGFYLSIMTLVFSLLILSIAGELEATGGPRGMSVGYELGVLDLGPLRWDLGSRWGGFLLAVLSAVVVVLALQSVLQRSRTGRAMVAVREDEVLASALGVALWRYKVIAFATSGAVAGLAGVYFAAYLRYITPGFFGMDLVMNSILIVVIGGTGFLLGPVVGAAAYAFLSEGVRAAGEYQTALLGAVLIAVVLFVPSGLIGAFHDLVARRASHGRRRAGSPSAAHDASVASPLPTPSRRPISVGRRR